MSYENKILKEFKMPHRKEVERALLIALFRHDGVVKEFSSNEEVVDELADDFKLDQKQRAAYLQTIYRKENRVKKSLLWHRLLFRAADSLAKENLVSRPTQTLKLMNKRAWMLTERGFDKALQFLNIPRPKKYFLTTKSFEVQKIIRGMTETPRPEEYDPFDMRKKSFTNTKEVNLRARGFRLAVIEAYDYRCAVCGLKIYTPDSLFWEVEAAHIVPHRAMGKDDIWNGLALCRLHHWCFDVGWFTLLDDYCIQVSSQVNSLPTDFGKAGNHDFLRSTNSKAMIILPDRTKFYPHHSAINWHRENVFHE